MNGKILRQPKARRIMSEPMFPGMLTGAFAVHAATNGRFFASDNLPGSITNGPFSLVAGNLAAGSCPLTVVAAAGGVLGTSAVVNLPVMSPAIILFSRVTAGMDAARA